MLELMAANSLGVLVRRPNSFLNDGSAIDVPMKAES